MTAVSSQLNNAELQRQRELEEWVRQTTFADLRYPSGSNYYLRSLEKVHSGYTRAAIYARVGTKKQVKDSGLSRQVGNCLEICIQRGLAVTEEDSIFLEIGQASDAARPVLQRLLTQCERGDYQAIVIASAIDWGLNWDNGGQSIIDGLDAAGTRLVACFGPAPGFSRLRPRWWQYAEATNTVRAIERLLHFAESSGKSVESLAQLWVREGEEGVLELIEPNREGGAAPSTE